MQIAPNPTVTEVSQLMTDYSNFELLGRGGFKTVFKASRYGIVEVLKFIGIPRADSAELPYQDECYNRAMREITVLKSCQNPAIVKLGGLEPRKVTVAGFEYVVYSEEYLDGRDLWYEISNQRKPLQRDCVLLLNSLLAAVEELWRLKVVHRDIKPHNIIKLPDPSRPYVLLDMGIAFSLMDSGLTFNADGRPPPSTYRYLAPEMTESGFRTTLDFRSDLYCCALTAYEYASGVHPIINGGEDGPMTIVKARSVLPSPLFKRRPDYSPDLCAIIDQLLSKKPALRPGNLNLLKNKLGKFL